MIDGTADSGIVRVLGCPQQSKSSECGGAYEPIPLHKATEWQPTLLGLWLGVLLSTIECMMRLSSL